MLTDFKFTLYQFLIFSMLQLLPFSSSGSFLNTLPANGKNYLKESMVLSTYFLKRF